MAAYDGGAANRGYSLVMAQEWNEAEGKAYYVAARSGPCVVLGPSTELMWCLSDNSRLPIRVCFWAQIIICCLWLLSRTLRVKTK
ncbi:hypothetical protein O9993_12305 [Vibrio lentus]|nr:hypothetical protein [Vibrio lentus]